MRAIESELGAMLGLKVVIERKAAGTGRLVLHYGDVAQLNDLCRRLAGDRDG
jgi:hypothetical protein